MLIRKLVFCSALLLPGCLSAQQPSSTAATDQSDLFWHPHVERDPGALISLNKAMAALGGDAFFGKLLSMQATGVLTGDSSKQFVWQLAGAEYRMMSTSGNTSSELNSGTGRPFGRAAGKATRIEAHIARSYVVPAATGVLLHQALINPDYDIRDGGTDVLGTESVSVVNITLTTTRLVAAATAQKWYFSKASGLPIRLAYRLFADGNPLLSTKATIDWSAYKEVQGGQFPGRAVLSFNGAQQGSFDITSVSINPSLDLGQFACPGDAQ